MHVTLALALLAADGITFAHKPARLEVLLDQRPLTAFVYDTTWDKPFLFPLRTVSGIVLSRGWPVEPRPGEEQDHAWHRGMWYGHGDINGHDFWREKPADKTTSRLVFMGPLRSSGSSFEAPFRMVTGKGERIGTLYERYGFARHGSTLIIDCTITINADASQALRFGDTDDGGFAFRLAGEFRQDRGARLANSEGQTGTENIWGKPARWTRYSAAIAGKPVSVVMLDHPANLRHPTRWHARGYSLNSANPFALRSFTKDKSASGEYTIPPGASLVLNYRVLIHEGDLTTAAIEQHFSKYAKALP